MINLSNLKNTTKRVINRLRVGRGIGSGTGKTCGRGYKGMGARAGSKRRYGYEGGQFRLFMKLPIRGFSNVAFQKKLDPVNLSQIEKMYNDGDVVNVQTLKARGFLSGKTHGIKILGTGELTKKVTIEANQVSESANEKLKNAGIKLTLKQ